MSGKFRCSSLILTLAGVTLLAAGPAALAAAGPVQDPVPIGPNQYFTGLVNGRSSAAPIRTDCIGPVRPGQTGHPLSGQTVEVKLAPAPASTDTGYTGSGAHSIAAYLSWPSPAVPPPPELVGTLTSYYVPEPIPRSITVPCAGSGTMSFVPTPGSPTAHTAKVRVAFLSQP